MTLIASLAAPPLAAITIFMAAGCAQTRRDYAPDFFAPEPTRTQLVTAAMKAQPATVRPGQKFEIIVQVRIAGGYHIYSTNAVQGPFTPTALNLLLPPELSPAGEWIASSEPVTRGGAQVYAGFISFRRLLKVRLNTAEQPLSVKAELVCQPCTDELCWPPAKFELSTAVSVSNGRKN